jgi:hypothetical protein
MSALKSRQADDGGLHRRDRKARSGRGGFYPEGELNRWVKRFQDDADNDGWLVAKAIAIAIRRRSKPGDSIGLRGLCHLTGQNWKEVIAVLYRMRGNGRLKFSKLGEDLDSWFLFTIPSASEEELWVRQKQSKRPMPAQSSECIGVKVKRLRPGRAMGIC